MDRVKFGFVILNYNSTEETIACIESIDRLSYDEKYIVVVDNASNDAIVFWSKIEKQTKKYNNIYFLASPVNGGYAKGNNIGIHYAKHELGCDYICIINPDTRIETTDFIEKCINTYKEYGYAVCGPKIVKDGFNTNPLGGYRESISWIIYQIWGNYRIYFVKKFDLKRFRRRKTSIEKHETRHQEPDSNTRFLQCDEGVQLSGACLVFSPLFVSRFEGLYNKTFLYCEETILAYACFRLALKLFYCNEIVVVHKGGQSLHFGETQSRERQMYISKVGAHSCMCVLKVFLHRNSKVYFEKILCPEVTEYTKKFE